MKNAKKLFADRLREAMTKAGLKPRPAVLERAFNLHYFGKPVTLHGVRKWLIGESIPPYDKISALAEMLKVPPEDLVFGLGIKQKSKNSLIRWDDGIGYQERKVFETFLTLPTPQRKIVREVIEEFSKVSPPEMTAAKNNAQGSRSPKGG
ncbi:MAG: XRE family transcriptional regulator [Proteobacteria bacterium]|nr:XRE family transcriptional regulator [Pseudomonadota bacterium]